MKISPDVAKYIQLQRTWSKKITDPEKLAALYENTVGQDYTSIHQFLPVDCSDVLDIGCGVGGIDILLFNHYNKSCNIHLLDKDGEGTELYYGYRKEASHYNSLDISKSFLVSNEVGKEKIFTYDANQNQYPDCKCQVILSLISCGFHYPASTYLEKIKNIKDGIIILDIRKHTDQVHLLKDNFSEVEVIIDSKKYERVLIK